MQEGIEGFALEMMTAGAHLGALAMARYVLSGKADNQTLDRETLIELAEAAKLEVREETKKGITNARGA